FAVRLEMGTLLRQCPARVPHLRRRGRRAGPRSGANAGGALGSDGGGGPAPPRNGGGRGGRARAALPRLHLAARRRRRKGRLVFSPLRLLRRRLSRGGAVRGRARRAWRGA